jgi:hypothetical protein
MSNSSQQFLRACTLLVSNSSGQAFDLSDLRIKFSVKRSGVMTPNVADIKVYNVSPQVISQIQNVENPFQFVTLQAGYQGNFGVIFNGQIKQFISNGRESATDTFIEMIAGDGDQAYNFAIVNTTLKAGSSPGNHLSAALGALSNNGVGQAYIGALPQNQLPRGKTMYGSARQHIKRIADTNGFVWSIQDQKVVFIKQSTYLPGTAVVLSSKTGMIGTPQQTVPGVDCKCLLNPQIKIHGRVQIDNKSVAQFKLDQFNPGSAANTPVPLNADGFYYVNAANHSGDTRGTDWYTSLSLLSIDVAVNTLDALPSNTFGGN